MEYETLDGAILAVLPRTCEVLSIVQHGSTNWSTGLRVDTLDGDEEKSYFVKIIEREELVGMAEAEYEGQKAIASVIPDNAVKPVAWGYFAETKSKAWYMAEFFNLRARAPPLEQFLPIVQQMHQKSVSPTGKFGFHVTPFYGPPPMVVDWTDSWEEFWVREFRSGLKYVEKMRGQDPELLVIAEDFIQKVAARLLRPLQTGGRNIKPSLCHGDLWDGNIQFNVDTQQPVIFDPCSFYGHHEMDFQCMRSPRYIIGQDFITLYKVKIGASEPSEDFDDRIALYSVRNDLMTAGMWPQWASLVDKAKGEMTRLIDKYPDGLDGFEGSLEPTIASVIQKPRVQPKVVSGNQEARDSESKDSAIDMSSPQGMAVDGLYGTEQQQPWATQLATAPANLKSETGRYQASKAPDTLPDTPFGTQLVGQIAEKDDEPATHTPPDTPSDFTHFGGENKDNSTTNLEPKTLTASSDAVDKTGLIGVGGGLSDNLVGNPPHDGTEIILETLAPRETVEEPLSVQKVSPRISEEEGIEHDSDYTSESTTTNTPTGQEGDTEYPAALIGSEFTSTKTVLPKLVSSSVAEPTAFEAPAEVSASQVAAENSAKGEWLEEELASNEVVTKRQIRLPIRSIRRKAFTLYSSRDKQFGKAPRQKAVKKPNAQPSAPALESHFQK